MLENLFKKLPFLSLSSSSQVRPPQKEKKPVNFINVKIMKRGNSIRVFAIVIALWIFAFFFFMFT